MYLLYRTNLLEKMGSINNLIIKFFGGPFMQFRQIDLASTYYSILSKQLQLNMSACSGIGNDPLVEFYS